MYNTAIYEQKSRSAPLLCWRVVQIRTRRIAGILARSLVFQSV